MSSYKYKRLIGERSDIDYDVNRERLDFKTRIVKVAVGLLSVCLVTSLGLNILLTTKTCTNNQSQIGSKPYLAGLTYDTPAIFEKLPQASSQEHEVHAGLEYTEIDIGRGLVLFDDKEAEAMGLPLGQRFPWDHSKGMYFVNAYHSLHCLNTIYRLISELNQGLPLTLGLEHATHCLNSLKKDVMCHADDTPRTSFKEYPGHSGTGQQRMCRDWKKLEEWADQRSGCWKYIEPGKKINNLLRYRYCNADSPYAERVREAMEQFGENFDRAKPAAD